MTEACQLSLSRVGEKAARAFIDSGARGELGTGRILSTDLRDFGAYRWKSRKPFQNLARV